MTDDPLIGRQLANFQVQQVIGRGGMGLVYRGQDVKLERPVAIKVIDVRYRSNPAYAERFIREARAIATWRHDNIVQIYYADDTDGLYYFVMEYIEGTDLGRVIGRHAAAKTFIPHAAVLHIARSLANALDYAHKKGVIHRDVKPANVMVANDQRVVLMDFGLAMDVQLGSLGEVFGSSHYIAPEQARRSADATPLSDLYSFGVVLYEMFTGRVPFDDPSATSVAIQHMTQPPPPPRELLPSLPEAVEAVLLRALAKEPADRYQSGAELIAALEAALPNVAAQTNVQVPIVPGGTADVPSRPSAPSAPKPATTPSHPTPGYPTPPPFNPDASLIGQQLDVYRVESLLGQGGMATIYRGIDVRLKRSVAIKVIDAPFRSDSEYAARFMREAQAIAQLEHPYIVRLYQYGDVDGLLYMAMEFIDGHSLQQTIELLRRNPNALPPRELVRIMREMGSALDYAHAKGVIHRDVKPSNIMIDRHQGRAVLADFGLALLTEVGTQGEIFGSPHYMAPEQAISSAKVVPQSDLYAMGVILYELFTGRVPFDDTDPLAIAMLHMSEPPKPLRALRPDISPQVEAVVMKALAKEPTQRYASGALLADALEEALQLSSPVAVQTPSQPIPQASATPSRPIPQLSATPSQPIPQLSATPSQPIPQASATPTQPSTPAAVPLPPPPAAVFHETPGQGVPATPVSQPIPAPPPRLVRSGPALNQRTILLLALAAALTLMVAVLVWRLLTNASTGTAPEPTPEAQVGAPVAAPSATQRLSVYRIEARGLLLRNDGEATINLNDLVLGDEKETVTGSVWGVTSLLPNTCVIIYSEEKDEEAVPIAEDFGTTCIAVLGQPVAIEKADRIWKEAWDIVYGGQVLGSCRKDARLCQATWP